MEPIRWYHEFDFPNGAKARSLDPDIRFHKKLWEFIENHLDKVDFAGKIVLDIGCWDGKWSFYSEKRGASSVLSTDDLTQNWSNGEGIHLAKRYFQSDIDVDQHRSVYNLQSLDTKFDIILFLGVYYHLHDPLLALSQIRHCCHEDSIVLIEGSVGCNYKEGEARYCFDDACQSTFLPSEQIWNKMLELSYFKVEEEYYFSIEKLQARKDLIKEPYADRKFIICTPMIDENKLHYYKSGFGLDIYDDRFMVE